MLALISLPIDQFKAKAHGHAYCNAYCEIIHSNANSGTNCNTSSYPGTSRSSSPLIFVFFAHALLVQ